jgi:purine catabolism regulator
VALVRDVVGEVWSALPADPVTVAVVRVPSRRAEELAELLEGRVADRPGTLFFASLPSGFALCCSPEQADLPALLAERFDGSAGVSNPVALTALSTGHEQALEALERARTGGRHVVRFRELTDDGVLALLTRTDVTRVAEAMLAPLLEHDEEHGGSLVPSLRVWLEHDGHAEEAAALLGVHRHTLRARIQTCARLLGRDLDSFPARADVWAALLALEPAVRAR